MRALYRNLFRRREVEAELEAEVQSYFALLVDRYVERGMPVADAQRQARVDMDGLERIKEEARDVRVGNLIESVIQDVRYGWRSLMKNPSFSAIAIVTLALGIGVNTAIFSVVYAVLLKPLPYDRPEQLALVWSDFEKTAALKAPTSGTILREIQDRATLLQEVAAMWPTVATFTGDGEAEQIKSAQVTSNFLRVLGVRPALGRIFGSEEEHDARPAVILCDSIWKRRFGGDPNIIGKGVRFAGAERVVVGVLPEDFRLRLSVGIPTDIEAFTPFQSNIYKGPRTLYFLRVIARMKPGVRVEQAQQEMNRIASEIRGSYVEYKAENLKLNIVGMQADAVRDIRPALVALFAGAGFVMLICCVNVANLLLARASERKKEVAVRSAIGASRSRVLRQLLTEGLLMCAIASAFGTGLAWAALRGLLKLQPDALTRAGVIGINWPVLGFVGLISIASVVLFGLAPSVESAKWDLITTLRESGRSSQGTVRQGVRAALIVAEIAIGFVLMVGAGLMIRTFAKVDQVRPGFESQGVLTFSLNLPRFASQQAMFNFVREWEAQAGSMPGVEAVGGSSHLPLDDYPNWYSPFRPEGVSSVEGAAFLADHRAVTPGYLKAMGTRLIEGRYFDDQDRADGRQVVIVDELLASTTWPGRSAVGKRIESEHFTAKGIEPVWADVVGVVEHVRSHSLSKKVRPEIYIPFEQSPRSPLSFAVRARVDPVALAGPIREMLHRRDPNIAISKVRPMAAYVEKAKAPASFTAVLAGIFGGLALILAAVGIYGVVYYSVSRRMHEMGVRMALGATGRDVRGLILREGLMLTAIGLLLGVAGGVVVSRELRDLIYGISAMDGITYGIAFTVLPLAALSGCWRPALKASSANPLDAIRAE